MKPLSRLPVIRSIKVSLNILWYGAWIIVPLGILLASVGEISVPWYFVDVAIDSTHTIGEMNYVSSGLPLPFHLHDKNNDAIDAIVKIMITPPNRLWAAAWTIIGLIGFVIGFVQLYLFRKLFASVKETSPFTLANAKRVRAIGWLIVLGHLGDTVLRSVLQNYLRKLVVTHGFQILGGPSINWDVLFFGFLILALAEFFRYGVELEEEKALTI